jgi:hypothetical protein
MFKEEHMLKRALPLTLGLVLMVFVNAHAIPPSSSEVYALAIEVANYGATLNEETTKALKSMANRNPQGQNISLEEAHRIISDKEENGALYGLFARLTAVAEVLKAQEELRIADTSFMRGYVQSSLDFIEIQKKIFVSGEKINAYLEKAKAIFSQIAL